MEAVCSSKTSPRSNARLASIDVATPACNVTAVRRISDRIGTIVATRLFIATWRHIRLPSFANHMKERNPIERAMNNSPAMMIDDENQPNFAQGEDAGGLALFLRSSAGETFSASPGVAWT
jgi:hypothetical protein